MKRISLIALLLSLSYCCRAQLTETQGWFFLSHTQKINDKFDILADVQLRSADQFEYLTTLLLRTALSYNFDKKHSAAIGYAYKGDWEHEDGGVAYTLENRVYEQYMYKFKAGKTEMMLRGRFEQRFIKEENVSFAQRGRAFISAQIPLFANADFSKGIYGSLQNEIFLNVTNKNKVNGSIFDQNRTLGGVGYRWSKKIDTDIGYYFWYQKEADASYRRNVIQLMVTSSF